jgi:hypothetical protein
MQRKPQLLQDNARTDGQRRGDGALRAGLVGRHHGQVTSITTVAPSVTNLSLLLQEVWYL